MDHSTYCAVHRTCSSALWIIDEALRARGPGAAVPSGEATGFGAPQDSPTAGTCIKTNHKCYFVGSESGQGYETASEGLERAR